MLKSLFLRAFCKKRDFSMDYGAPGSFRSSGLVGTAFSIQQNTCSGNLFPEVGSGMPGCLGYGGVLKTAFLHFRCNFLDFSTFAARRRRNIARKPESPKREGADAAPSSKAAPRRRWGRIVLSREEAPLRIAACPAASRLPPVDVPPTDAASSRLALAAFDVPRYPWPSPIAHLLDIRPTRPRPLCASGRFQPPSLVFRPTACHPPLLRGLISCGSAYISSRFVCAFAR